MRRRSLISHVLGLFALAIPVTVRAADEPQSNGKQNSTAQAERQHPADSARSSRPTRNAKEIADRIFKREKEEVETIENTAPIVETYIQEEKSDPVMGTLPKKDLYFLGQADFHGKRIRLHSMIPGTLKKSFAWSYEPAGFLQMAFLDLSEFDSAHYRLTPPDRGQQTFLGEVRCYVFNVEAAPKVKGARFRGRIWVEDQAFTIVRMNGTYAPENSFSIKHFQDEFYEPFDSWRTNVKSGLWVPSDIYIQDMREPPPTGGPRFKARVHLWGYGLTTPNNREELNQLLVETEGQVKDETEKQDRSPLDQQRGWRALSERNVLEVLQRVGLVAPEGNVEKVLNTIVNNILVTNSFNSGIDIRCRVLLTSDLEMFSMQNTIVLSRGLIDVVPNEETLAALLAFEIADVMVPKPAQDQYAFSDILRLSPTEALRKLSFADNSDEAQKNSDKAVQLLKKSPYGEKLSSVGLFLSQLQSQKPALKQLIRARLGNQVYFTSRLLQLAPDLNPASLQQLGALPMGSRIKLNAWNDNISLIETHQMAPLSPREKIPFEVTPIDLHLTRYMESSREIENSIVPESAFAIAAPTVPE